MPFPLARSFGIGGLQVSTFGLFLLGAALVVVLIVHATTQGAAKGSGLWVARERLLGILLAGWVGARLGAQLIGIDISLKQPLSWLGLSEQSLQWEGAVVAALLYLYLSSSRSWTTVLQAGDVLAPALAIGAAILWLGFGYVGAQAPPWPWTVQLLPGLYVHPVQFYAYIAFSIVALILAWQGRQPDYPGQNLWTFVLFAAVIRFGLSVLIPTSTIDGWMGLGWSQWGPIFGILLGWFGMSFSQQLFVSNERSQILIGEANGKGEPKR